MREKGVQFLKYELCDRHCLCVYVICRAARVAFNLGARIYVDTRCLDTNEVLEKGIVTFELSQMSDLDLPTKKERCCYFNHLILKG